MAWAGHAYTVSFIHKRLNGSKNMDLHFLQAVTKNTVSLQNTATRALYRQQLRTLYLILYHSHQCGPTTGPRAAYGRGRIFKARELSQYSFNVVCILH